MLKQKKMRGDIGGRTIQKGHEKKGNAGWGGPHFSGDKKESVSSGK